MAKLPNQCQRKQDSESYSLWVGLRNQGVDCERRALDSVSVGQNELGAERPFDFGRRIKVLWIGPSRRVLPHRGVAGIQEEKNDPALLVKNSGGIAARVFSFLSSLEKYQRDTRETSSS